jgi:UDP-galactopyranose mutase
MLPTIGPFHKQGIRVSKYGAHLFHTNNERVWEYVTRFVKWARWDHEVSAPLGFLYGFLYGPSDAFHKQVLAYVDGQHIPVPVNINTVNRVFPSANINGSAEMDAFLSQIQVSTAFTKATPLYGFLYGSLFGPSDASLFGSTL